MTLFMTEHDHRNGFGDSVENLRSDVERVANEQILLKQSHIADLSWIVTELKGVLASWGDTEILNAVTKERVRHLVVALTEKIEEGS